jgi:hypothetical protein
VYFPVEVAITSTAMGSIIVSKLWWPVGMLTKKRDRFIFLKLKITATSV